MYLISPQDFIVLRDAFVVAVVTGFADAVLLLEVADGHPVGVAVAPRPDGRPLRNLWPRLLEPYHPAKFVPLTVVAPLVRL